MEGRAPAFNAVKQHIHPPLRHVLRILVYGGQPGHQVVGHGNAVKAHHRDILRHPSAHVPYGADGAHGHDIADGENGGQLRAALQQAAGGGVGLRHGIAAGLALADRVKGQVKLPERPLTAQEAPDTESVTPHADLTMSVPYGRYYIYVVANMGDLSGYADRIKTVSGLKSLPLRWNSDDISANGQMLGHFCDDKTIEDTAPLLTIDKKNTTFHSWIRRAASKVTVAYDGSKLEEGVFIYLKSVQIKDIPLNCPLGDSNEPGENDRLIPDGETITYGTGTNYDEFWPARITKGRAYYPYDKDTYGLSADAHTEKAEALYFYENMQGEGEIP